MADKTVFYKSSFGDLRLWLTNISTDRTRDLVEHKLSAGDEHVVQDRGRGIVRARCSVLFASMAGDDLSPLDRCRALQAIVDDKPRVFSHPTSGSYLARIGPFTEVVDERGVITADIEVVRVAPIEGVSPAGAGTISIAGFGAVKAAADELAAQLKDIGIPSTLPDDATAAVDSWSETDLIDPRTVLTQVGSLTSQAGTQADALDDDIDAWSAFKATVLLAEAIRSAADASTASTAQTFVVKIGQPVALRALLAGIYSAEEADARYDQAMALNDLPSPAWLEPGSELVLPQITPPARSG